jgi:protein gp37
MADNTKIEWADATLNYVNGCSVLSPGCTNCYAMKLAGTRLKHVPSRAGLTQDSKAGPVWTGEVRANDAALMDALRWKRGRRIFWNAHGDLFHEAVPYEWIDRLFAVCALTPQHTHMILTKRSARMRAWFAALRDRGDVFAEHSDWIADVLGLDDGAYVPEARDFPLPNVWLGVSVEDQQRADERIPDLLATPAAKRFLSCEPLLGPVDLRDFMWPVCKSMPARFKSWDEAEAAGELTYKRQALVSAQAVFLDWVIAGGESGSRARPMHPDWARGLRDQCQAAGVPFFFKQWGCCLPGNMDGEDEHGNAAYEIEDVAQPVDYDKLGRGKLIQAHGCDFIRFHRAKPAGRLLDGREWNGLPNA